MGKSSSSKSKNVTQDIEKVQEPHLSGAYIRSLVKQLTTSRTKDSPNTKDLENSEVENNKNSAISDHKNDKSPQQHKKQVRRRLHTSRPYQERLLNMAEARREIVTALKFHRAAMKQNEKQQDSISSSSSASHQFSSEQEEAFSKSRRNSRIYASNSSPSNYLSNYTYSNGNDYSSSPYSWPYSQNITPPPLPQENLNFQLPNQTLGLNLNLQDFNNIDTIPYHFDDNPSSKSAATAPPCEVAETIDSGGLHLVMDDKELAEIRLIGEQHQIEWDDTLNLMTSAWWFNIEIGCLDQKPEDYVSSPSDIEVMEFPAWIDANEQHVNECSSDEYLQNPALPCMDIEEIDGMDGDWLA